MKLASVLIDVKDKTVGEIEEMNGGTGIAESVARLDVASIDELARSIGRWIGPGGWFAVEQPLIDAYAALTGDDHWVHVDRERARRELPGGRTIAHGLLTLSLLPRLWNAMFTVGGVSRAINYGSDRIRYAAPVPAGSRIRLEFKISDVTPKDGCMHVTFDNEVYVDTRADRPAMVARTLIVYYR